MQNLPDFNSLWDYQNPNKTEQNFREILDNVKENKHPIYVAELKTQIARTLGLQQKFDEGHKVLDEVKNSNVFKNELIKTRYLLERGRLFNSNQQQEKAIPLFQEAFELGVSENLDYYAIDAAHMIAYAKINLPIEKIEWELKALILVDNTEDKRAKKWEGSLYNNLGWSYFDLKDYDNAIVYFMKSMDYEDASGNSGKVRIAKWSIAKCERMKGNVALALKNFKDLEAEIVAQNLDADGYVFEEIAECYLALKDTISAKPYFAKAYNILSQDVWLQKNEASRLERLETLAN